MAESNTESPRSLLWRDAFMARLRLNPRPDGYNAVADAAVSADAAVDAYDKKFPGTQPEATPAAKPAKSGSKS